MANCSDTSCLLPKVQRTAHIDRRVSCVDPAVQRSLKLTSDLTMLAPLSAYMNRLQLSFGVRRTTHIGQHVCLRPTCERFSRRQGSASSPRSLPRVVLTFPRRARSERGTTRICFSLTSPPPERAPMWRTRHGWKSMSWISSHGVATASLAPLPCIFRQARYTRRRCDALTGTANASIQRLPSFFSRLSTLRRSSPQRTGPASTRLRYGRRGRGGAPNWTGSLTPSSLSRGPLVRKATWPRMPARVRVTLPRIRHVGLAPNVALQPTGDLRMLAALAMIGHARS